MRPIKIIILTTSATRCGLLTSGFARLAFANNWLMELIDVPHHHHADVEGLQAIVRTHGFQAVVVTHAFAGLGQLLEIGVPVLAMGVDEVPRGITRVEVDDAAVGREAADHLMGLGLRHFRGFGFSAAFATRRFAAFRAAIEAAGGAYDSSGEVGDRLDDLGRPLPNMHRMRPWLQSMPKPIGIFAGCDRWGAVVIRSCHEFGIRVPEDVAVIGAENEEIICTTLYTPMSSVNIPLQRIGYECALACDKILLGELPRGTEILIPPTGVVARRSTDGVIASYPEVTAALSFIRANSHQKITVPDILKHVPTGRHTLQRAFRKTLGKSIVSEIRRAHIERARQLLATTDLSIKEIADRTGFPDSHRLGRVFRQETGKTPTEYRGQFDVTERL
jgi:LacI family transcriptional regulator